ncbi:4Fe-4S dicluster domain-containing protein [Candidatus Poribacteria bacterium]|nr:4Fe-4S dicluster domain-containing protein [Candidatus Poribacteria bacterium]
MARIRIVSQAVFFALFAFFAFVTEFGHLRGYPVSLFLEADPLVGIATAITTHSLYRGLLWSLVLLIPTLLLGRIFCGWICPFGSIHHFTGWIASNLNIRRRLIANSYRPLYAFKYYLLAAMVVAALFGSLQIGLLDPIATVSRSLTVAILPALDTLTQSVYVRPYEFRLAWVVGFLFVFFVGMNLVIPRFFCRALCPLGATLGVLSRFSLWRIHRDIEKCNGCDLCRSFCEGASDPQAKLRKSECFVCMNCLDDCPEDALAFRFLPDRSGEVTNPDVARRRLLFAGVAGLLFFPFARRSGATTKDFDKQVIRPPGSVAESLFLERCIKCDQCLRVCPTNTLQPALFEAGVEGIWTPILNMRMGYCELNCTLCGQVCPTGAIQRISIPQKLGLGEFSERGRVRLGTAFYDRGRCLPWAMDTPCVVCEEVCPVSPKAIFTRPVTVTTRIGQALELHRPYVDPTRCIGCGICEHECPVRDERAVRVTAVGETRSTDRRLLLTS